MDIITGRDRLVAAAYRLKKAWLIGVAIVGTNRISTPVSAAELIVPDYDEWSRAKLQSHVKALEADLEDILRKMVQLRQGRKQLYRIAQWLEAHYERWLQSGQVLYTIGIVNEFEKQVGQLRCRDHMETPAYGEMLLQGRAYGLVIRHPEYMLVSDLGLFFDLHLDVARLIDSAATLPVAVGENRQSLARAVILTCFNLLESFTNGLPREYLMTGENLNEPMRHLLEDMQEPLKKRLLKVVRTVSGGSCSLEINKPPMSVLFGPIKERRDAFVHCEPGPQLSARGYSKEAAFHDVSPAIVNDAVSLTFEVIRIAWKDVHKRNGPRWLPNWDGERFGKKNIRLIAPNASAADI